MDVIVRGTTPTIEYIFGTINPADITDAVLTIEHRGVIVVEKDLTDAVVGANSLTWVLTQSETLAFPQTDYDASRRDPAHMMVNWLTSDGTRGVSKRLKVIVGINDYNEVMS